MKRNLLLGLMVCVSCLILWPQSHLVPTPPLTTQDAERGDLLRAKSDEIRAEINKMGPTQPLPFKITDNLYSVGFLNAKAYLLTSPQGHILLGAGYPNTGEIIENNMQGFGFKLSDVKAILISHYHNDAAGSAAYLKERSGAQVMASFPEIAYLEHGGVPPTPRFGRGGGEDQGAQAQQTLYPSVKVDRALFDGDVIQIGPLKVTAYVMPGHTPGSTSYVFTTREGNRGYKVLLFCCWEYPQDLAQNVNISEAATRHTLETFHKLVPVDIYLSGGAFETSGILNQPANVTVPDRIARIKSDSKVWIDRQIFTGLAASREVEFDRKIDKLKTTNPIYK